MNCAACSQRDEEGQLEERCKDNRKRWACDAAILEGEKPLKTAKEMETALPLMRCPWAEAVPRMSQALPYFKIAFEHGVLPSAGAMLDQTADFQRGLLLYSRLMGRVEAEAIAEQNSKNRIKA